ncbi:MAG TPA: hypothetical protein VFJ47_01560, partial [Terriglobales bacterium]|nr:hypothetical protein [Terriglobales bacterium]
MRITVYRRHTKDCAHTDNKFYQRCECPVWFEAHVMGRRWDTESESWVKTPKYESIQSRWSSKQSNWRAAEHMARQFEHKLEDVITGRAPAAGSDKTVKDAVEQFLNEKATTITKRGQRISDDTLYRHEFTLKQLQEFCTEQGIVFLKDITLAHLRSWRTKWTVNAAHARRSFQERVKNFLTFCHTNGWIPTNPAAGLNSIPVVVGSDAIRPLTQEEYSRLLAAIDKTTMTAENKTRIKVLMQLQRQSGLSLVDAV